MLPNRKAASLVPVCVACTCWWFTGETIAGEDNLRTMQYTSRAEQPAMLWQKELRSELVRLLKMDDLISRKTSTPFHPKALLSETREKYLFQEFELNSTSDRRIKVVLTLPTNLKGHFPAVVVIGGHGGTRRTCYGIPDGYFRFAHVLAEKGYVTISTRVSQHEVYEEGRTLMGERLWDLMRCVDFLTSLEEVDSQRIGCAGLSLGGEMAMWLGAMDERVQATLSSGFLTKMDQLENNNCMCWKFPGLRELVDFSDIYAMIAPRALLCQNGRKEPRTKFPISIARGALTQIEQIYADFEQPQNVALVAHQGGHVIHLPSLLSFFDTHLGRRKDPAEPGDSADAEKTNH